MYGYRPTDRDNAAHFKDDVVEVQHDASSAAAPGVMITQSVTHEQDKQIAKALPGGTAFDGDEDDSENESDFEDDDKEESSEDECDKNELRLQYNDRMNDLCDDPDYGYNYDNDYDDDDDDDDEKDDNVDPIEFLKELQSRAPPAQELRPAREPTAFDRIPELRKAREESHRKKREDYRQWITSNQQRVCIAAEGKQPAKDVEGNTTMGTGEPGAENLAEVKLSANRQETVDLSVARGIIVYEHQKNMYANQQGPSVGEEAQLFVTNGQATQEALEVTVRLPPYAVVEQRAPSVEEENELFIEDEQIMQGGLKVTVRLTRSQ